MKIKIQIKHKIFGTVLFEYEKEDNTIKDTVLEAIRQKADLRYADLRYADLSYADLSSADLRSADLRSADLLYADLSSADLRSADLRYADLRYADLRYADLSSADLSYADLRSADLSSADLHSADLSYAKNFFVGLSCPSDGAFIGWKKIGVNAKKLNGTYLVKLEIPEDALRSSATTSKCRCNKAKVLEITNIATGENIDSITNTNEKPCVYKVGELVLPDSFDEDRWKECSHGIHFFINKQEAINY